MTSPNIDLETQVYINSESEFNYLRLRGFLDRVLGFITGHNMHLLSFTEIVDKLRLRESIYRGLQDIPIAHIVGSTGRYNEFTRHFFPYSLDKRDKERWRKIYTLAVTGKGFPPIEVYKIDQIYFVHDGNHRVSVAKDLGWETIQANVTELPCAIPLTPDVEPDALLIKEEWAYFLERTHLDQTRPDSKEHLRLTEPGGYQSLLRHIKLHLSMMHQNGQTVGNDKLDGSLERAAADWYDHVYQPAIAAVRQSDIMRHFPGRSEGDLYLWLVRHQEALRRNHDFDALHLSDQVTVFLQTVERLKMES